MRFTMLVVAVLATAVALPGPAMGQAATGDSVVGSGISSSDIGDLRFNIDARSGPSGENPTGSAAVSLVDNPLVVVSGPVTCLTVTGNHAVIGIRNTSPYFIVPGSFIEVTDGTPDLLGGLSPGYVPTVCPATVVTQAPVIFGDLSVTDAQPSPVSKDQCKNGGWRNFPGFKNQGDCVSFVATKGKNPPAGH